MIDIQYYGGNCIVLTKKDLRIVVDDNLEALGLKSITKPGDIVLFTGDEHSNMDKARLVVNQPGEYEIAGLSIIGIPAQSHLDPKGPKTTMYKLVDGTTTYLFTGHIYPSLSEGQLEAIGMVDVLFVPVGDNGYTLDAVGALELIKKIEPKIVVPTHYADEALQYPVIQQALDQVLKNLSMEPQETVVKLCLKPGDLAEEATRLLVMTRS